MAVYCCPETNSAGNLKWSPEIKGATPNYPQCRGERDLACSFYFHIGMVAA